MDLEIIKSSEHYSSQEENVGYFHFSFAEFFDTNKMNIGPLRVFNEYLLDSRVTNLGYGSIRDIEILLYLVEGELSYKNDKGIQEILRAGDLFLISSGIGVISSMRIVTKPARLLEIWIFPSKYSLTPSIMKRHIANEEYTNKILQIVTSEKKSENTSALKIHQDVNLYISKLDSENEVWYNSNPERELYLFLINGKILINNNPLFARDAAKIAFSSSENITLRNDSSEMSEIMLIDLEKEG